jgi:hypothetical protein
VRRGSHFPLAAGDLAELKPRLHSTQRRSPPEFFLALITDVGLDLNGDRV